MPLNPVIIKCYCVEHNRPKCSMNCTKCKKMIGVGQINKRCLCKISKSVILTAMCTKCRGINPMKGEVIKIVDDIKKGLNKRDLIMSNQVLGQINKKLETIPDSFFTANNSAKTLGASIIYSSLRLKTARSVFVNYLTPISEITSTTKSDINKLSDVILQSSIKRTRRDFLSSDKRL